MKQKFAVFTVMAVLLCLLAACGSDKNGGTTGETANGDVAGAENGTTSGMTGNVQGSAAGELKTDPANGTRYTGRNDDPVARYGNGYGNTSANKSLTKNATANATLHGSYNNPTGTPAGRSTSAPVQEEAVDPAAAGVRYRLMLDNAHVRDTDGFLLDGENPHHDTLR